MGKKHDSQYANFGWLHNKSPGKHDKSYGMRLFRILKIMLPGHFLGFCLL